MDNFWIEVGKNALVVGIGGSLVALGNYAVRRLGRNIAAPERMERIEKRQDRTDEAVKTILSVNKHQTAGLRAVVEAVKPSLNGSYDRTIRHLDEADQESDEFLRSNYGGE